MSERVDPEAVTDRELDAMVAEQVCGWTDAQVEDGDLIGWHNNKPLTVSDPLAIVPYYSATGHGMLLVVEAMAAKSWHCRITSPFQPGDQWFGGFTPQGMTGWNGRPDHQVGANSGPRAVALAALRAVGGEM